MAALRHARLDLLYFLDGLTSSMIEEKIVANTEQNTDKSFSPEVDMRKQSIANIIDYGPKKYRMQLENMSKYSHALANENISIVKV